MNLQAAMELVQEEGVAILQADPNLTAIGVGAADGGPVVGATDYAVTASVPRKLPKAELRRRDLQPFEKVFAAAVGKRAAVNVDIQIVETGGPFEPQVGLVVPIALRGVYGGNPAVVDTQKHFASLRTGIGITNPVGAYPGLLSVGTLGFCVRDGGGTEYLVSNNHVIAHVNAASKADAVVQPGSLDLTNAELTSMPTLAALVAALRVATLTDWVPIKFPTPTNTPHNLVDLALAELVAGSRLATELHRVCFGGSIRAVAAPFTVDPATGQLVGPAGVYKVGRTTGYTEGIVTRIAVASRVNYSGKSAFFTNQIEVAATADNVGPFSRPGDSGSGVLNHAHELVGLLFAGTDERTLVNPIDAVMTALGGLVTNPVLITG